MTFLSEKDINIVYRPEKCILVYRPEKCIYLAACLKHSAGHL